MDIDGGKKSMYTTGGVGDQTTFQQEVRLIAFDNDGEWFIMFLGQSLVVPYTLSPFEFGGVLNVL